jgi:hypothetical protein
MDGLNEIQNRARLLANYAPDNARDYWRELEGLKICRQHDDMAQFVETSLHGMHSYQELCFQDRDRMTELAKLVIVHLPELSCEYVRINPPWRFDQEALDWKPIVAELRKIEEIAVRKLLAKAAKVFLLHDPATEARDKWLYDQCVKRVRFSAIIRKLDGKPRTWLRITSINGIKRAANAYAERHSLPPIPSRQRGRPARK